MMRFELWLDTFLEEKGINLAKRFEVVSDTSGLTHNMPYSKVVESIKVTGKAEQAAIKDMLVRIDFVNGDVCDYLRHLGKAFAF